VLEPVVPVAGVVVVPAAPGVVDAGVVVDGVVVAGVVVGVVVDGVVAAGVVAVWFGVPQSPGATT
jgi:hypothetical protein